MVDFRKHPSEKDGKPVVVMSPSTAGLMTWITGAGDDASPTPPASGRGEGDKIHLNFTGAGDKTINFTVTQPVELHDGALWYTPVANWTPADEFSFSGYMPATATTVAGGNDGNCNLIDIGGYNLITPAAGDGTHNVDLALAVPVPAKGNAGYWDTDYLTGVVTPSGKPGKAEWHLLDVPVESFFIKRIPMGHPLGIFEIDVYKAEWISERWILKIRVNKVTDSPGDAAGWLMLFREDST